MKRKIIFSVFALIFVISASLLAKSYYDSYKAEKLYNEARQIYYKNIEDAIDEKINKEQAQEEIQNSEISEEEITEEEPAEEELAEEPVSEVVEETTTPPRGEEVRQVDKADVENFKKNVIGWIDIEGTNIDYPVVQAEDNEYYLDRNYKGEKDAYGSIYMDFRNVSVPRDDNIIIYGHKIRDGSMFSDLAKYTNSGTYKDYFENKDIISLEYNGEKTNWEIYSAYVINLDKEDYYLYTIYKDREKYKSFIEETKERSMLTKDIEITEEDTIISLVTCNFWYDNARVIIHGKLIS